ncbi:multimerin-2-like isoform X2 [Takifugu flavidus]|uniref:multimerin-2-like isoform X2 n=1 Tax=Takifugu flavidus TaxID=433684 RepID=UPI0025442113|nr:multimerin-2-like isoform X2 [Takifugu flavidus]
MKVVGQLVLVVGLLVSIHYEVRAKDPDVVETDEEKEQELGGRPTRGSAEFSHHMKATKTPPLKDGERDSAQRWYKHSTQTAHRPKQQMVATTLLWCCCRGNHCEDRDFAGHPIPDIMQMVMVQLQPLLDGFNHSLEHLSRHVAELARNIDLMKSRQQEVEFQVTPLDSSARDEVVQVVEKETERENQHASLEQVLEQVMDIHWQMKNQRTQVENRLHSQHVMLHYNLTSFKTDVDAKLKRHHKMLQVNLQAMNTTLAELKLVVNQPTEAEAEPPQPSDPTALWEAIKRLDDMMVNNTVNVNSLIEDVEMTSRNIQLLRQDFRSLEKQINQTARNSQVQFMETGLEVEAAREVVLQRVAQLAGNLSKQSERLQEMDVDLDYVYSMLYKDNSSSDCGCKSLKTALAGLERSVANVTELANKNQQALEEESEGVAAQWDVTSDWEPAVQVVQQDLQQMRESIVLEQSRTQILDHSLAQLSNSVNLLTAEVSVLKDYNRKLAENMQRWSGSFKSLLKDVVRHNDVLGLLLGEEVLEFLEWPIQNQREYSILALKEQLGVLQEQMRSHNLSISSLLALRTGTREELPSADQPSSSPFSLPIEDWLPRDKRRGRGRVSRTERQHIQQAGRNPEQRAEGSDLWSLEKKVDELKLKVLWLEDRESNTSAGRGATNGGVEDKLQAEVTWLKRGLEEHLRMFRNVFSNADLLEKTQATLELDKLWQLMKTKDAEKEKQKQRGEGRGVRQGPRKGGEIH